MGRTASIAMLLLPLAGCGGQDGATSLTVTARALVGDTLNPAPGAESRPAGVKSALVEARRGFATRLDRQPAEGQTAPQLSPNVFRLVRYDAPAGKLGAYLTPDPGDGRKHPAIVWITGGDRNTIDELWSEAPPDNDQTAAAYRRAGIIRMFPSLRGGNDNPGRHEGFLGEVDDVLAAVDFLGRQRLRRPRADLSGWA